MQGHIGAQGGFGREHSGGAGVPAPLCPLCWLSLCPGRVGSPGGTPEPRQDPASSLHGAGQGSCPHGCRVAMTPHGEGLHGPRGSTRPCPAKLRPQGLPFGGYGNRGSSHGRGGILRLAGCCACKEPGGWKMVPSAQAEPSPALSHPWSSEMRSPKGRVCRRPASAAGSPQPSTEQTQLLLTPTALPLPQTVPRASTAGQTAAPVPEPRTGSRPQAMGMGTRLLRPGTSSPRSSLRRVPLGRQGPRWWRVAIAAQLPVPARPLPPAAAATLLFCPEPARTTGAIVVGGSRKTTVLPAEPASPGTRTQPRGAQHGAFPAGHRGALTHGPAQPYPPGPNPRPVPRSLPRPPSAVPSPSGMLMAQARLLHMDHGVLTHHRPRAPTTPSLCCRPHRGSTPCCQLLCVLEKST